MFKTPLTPAQLNTPGNRTRLRWLLLATITFSCIGLRHDVNTGILSSFLALLYVCLWLYTLTSITYNADQRRRRLYLDAISTRSPGAVAAPPPSAAEKLVAIGVLLTGMALTALLQTDRPLIWEPLVCAVALIGAFLYAEHVTAKYREQLVDTGDPTR